MPQNKMGKDQKKAARSLLMSKVKGKGNLSTEIRLLGILRANKISGWRRHIGVKGTPDFGFHKQKVAIFVDGCFWHGCPQCYRQPKSNKGFWRNKVLSNKIRDAEVNAFLRRKGWNVCRIRECQFKKPLNVIRRLKKLLN